MSELLLQLKNVSVHYGGVKAVDSVSLAVDEGEVIALMGPNGAGKSTVLKAIFGLVPIDSGEVLWHEYEITPIPHEVVLRGVSFVPQGRRVFAHLSVQENLEMGGFVLSDKHTLNERVADVLDLFPALKPKIKEKSGTLSGGQQQMVALARGLITDPKVLLLDEPTLGLAPRIVKQVFEKVVEINERRTTAIVVVEHNLKTLLKLVHRAYVLDKGRIVAEDSGSAVLKSDILEKVFLGVPRLK